MKIYSAQWAILVRKTGADTDIMKGVASIKQQNGEHASRNPRRSV